MLILMHYNLPSMIIIIAQMYPEAAGSSIPEGPLFLWSIFSGNMYSQQSTTINFINCGPKLIVASSYTHKESKAYHNSSGKIQRVGHISHNLVQLVRCAQKISAAGVL